MHNGSVPAEEKAAKMCSFWLHFGAGCHLCFLFSPHLHSTTMQPKGSFITEDTISPVFIFMVLTLIYPFYTILDSMNVATGRTFLNWSCLMPARQYVHIYANFQVHLNFP